MKFEETLVQDELVVRVHVSRIVADVAPEFKQGLIAHIKNGKKSVILDLGDVTFIDSSGLGALIGGLKAMDGSGELVLCNARDAVISMLKLTRMDKIFAIYDTAEAAAAALSSRDGADREKPNS